MKADTLFINIGQLVTPIGAGARGGRRQAELQVIEDAAFAVQDDKIVWVGQSKNWIGAAREVKDLAGCAVVPGLIDPHTHAVWAGNRLADFEARASGVQYEEILRLGGGIRSSIRATSAASLEDLVDLALPRLLALQSSGATTIEVKSGYGFSLEAELRCLEAIKILQSKLQAHLEPTLLIHVPPQNASERPAYLEMVCSELIPMTAEMHLAQAVDVFIEREAFNENETRRILETAQAHGLAVKLHADQFHCIGGLELGVELGALSVDHLEVSGEKQIAAIATSQTIATILPGVTLHLGLPAAPARALLEAGAAVAIGTDLNPGSSPVFSIQVALALGVRLNRLTPAEALVACTVNAAAALGLSDRGRLEVGCLADALVLHSSNWLELAYVLGANPVKTVLIAGQEVL
jgi:imidazolonepropionase